MAKLKKKASFNKLDINVGGWTLPSLEKEEKDKFMQDWQDR